MATLKKHSLTSLYNACPRWLAHVVLDRAIWSAIGRHEPPEETADETILGRLLAVNLERAAASKAVRHS